MLGEERGGIVTGHVGIGQLDEAAFVEGDLRG